MGLWQINADTLAGGRFVVSALNETIACLVALQRATAALPGVRAWRDALLPAYRERLSDDPVSALLVRVGLFRLWFVVFLSFLLLGVGVLFFVVVLFLF